jgi:hypothetical protein
MQENNTSGKIYKKNPEFGGGDERLCNTLGVNFRFRL